MTIVVVYVLPYQVSLSSIHGRTFEDFSVFVVFLCVNIPIA